MITDSLRIASLLALAGVSLAQSPGITYVDADCVANTTLADGSPYTPVPGTAVDNHWNLRVFANVGTILSSNDSGTENAPMLRTTLSGLTPGAEYYVYGYFWGTAGAAWRSRGLLSTAQPAPELPGYITLMFSGTTFTPMQPLAATSPLGVGQSSLGLTYDASGNENSGHFANTVKIQEANRWMFEARYGSAVADANGQIQVYVDDHPNTGNGNRCWYDGVGYELAPGQFGGACAAPAVGSPTIGSTGYPLVNRAFSVNLSSGPANALGILVFGFSNTSWTGGPLPQSLGFAGFPGCDLNVSPDISIATLTDANGAASYSLTLAGVPSLGLYFQWAALNGNDLGVTRGLQVQFHQ